MSAEARNTKVREHFRNGFLPTFNPYRTRVDSEQIFITSIPNYQLMSFLLTLAVGCVIQAHLFDIEARIYLSDFRTVIDGKEEAAFGGFELVCQVLEILRVKNDFVLIACKNFVALTAPTCLPSAETE